MRGTPGADAVVVCKMCNNEFKTKFAKDGLPEETRCRKCSKTLRKKRSVGGGVAGYATTTGAHKIGNKIPSKD